MLPMPRRARLLTGLFVLLLLMLMSNNILANDNNIFWNELGHNSRDPLYRYPTGAVPTGTPITLRMRAANGDLTGATVRVWNDRQDFQLLIPMTRVASDVQFTGDPTTYEFWEATLPASDLPTVYWYRFILVDGSATVYYEDDVARLGGWGQASNSSNDWSWQLSVYDPAFQTPDWVQNGVVYQIFTDRFRDAVDTNHTPAGSFFYGNNDTVYRSNDLESDWNTAICDPRDALGTSPCPNIYSQNFYGGDLAGITEKLDYLNDLGVTVLYLNPIFESPSNHKYDTTDFFQIDDNFGTLADFQTLATEAHNRGMRVVLDGVFNHSSSDSIYFDRYSRWDSAGNPTTVGLNDGSGACESLSSPYVDWYNFFPYVGTGSAPCSDNRDYPKWFGIFDSLPVYNHDNPEVRDLFINNGTSSIGPYWMQWADGWRLDVAPEIDHGTINDPSDDYWEDFRTAVHAVRSDAYIVGEEWGNATSWTLGGEWDATMNYQFSAATISFWRDTAFTDNDFNGGSSAGPLNPTNPSQFNDRLLYLQERYAPEAFYAMMNLFGSHDTNRVLFLLDDNAASNNTALYYDPNYDWSTSLSRLRGAALVQMTMPGAPTIYYGDEVGTVNPPSWDGSQWQDDPYNRAPYPWLDESGTPFYAHMQNAGTQQNLYDYYALLTSIRHANPALRVGSLDTLLTDDVNGIYAYGRQMADMSNTAVVVVNKTNATTSATINLVDYVPVNTILVDALTGSNYSVDSAGDVLVNLPARGGVILTSGALTRPATVNDLAATPESGQVSLTWSAVSGADSYDVYRSRLHYGGFELIGNATSTSYTDTGVSNSVPYVYRIEAKDDTTLLTGDPSNEASATPALSIGWANLQWPPSLTHSVSATDLSDTIYGQIWIDGVTSQAGATPGLWAQVGYGDSNNVNDGSWQWFDMTFNVDAGNNDEFMGNLPRTDIGTFCYTTRYSTDSGASWFHAVNGPDEGNLTCPGPFGVLTVVAADDVTPPDAPLNLAVSSTSDSSVSLVWDTHPNTDGDLYGFRLYREDTATPGFTLVKTVVGAAESSTSDDTVTAGGNYNYYITAIDANLNESPASNTINADAILLMVEVTFRVTVPAYTPGVYPVHIVGPFNGWDPGNLAYALTEVSPNVWEITLDLLDGSTFIHKFARSSWDRVEKQANGYDEVPDRSVSINYGSTGTQLIEVTIANWRDPIVTSISPADDAVDVAANTPIVFSWNKWMPTPPSGVTVTGSSGVVAGTFSFDEPSLTHTFTPSAPLQPGLHTVHIEGAASGGDVQQVPADWSFSVIEPFEVSSITLIDANTNVPIAAYDPIPTGSLVSIDLATLGTNRVNLRANVLGSTGSVVFDVNDILANRIENGAPYAFAGDNNGDYNAWMFNINTNYVIRATPYKGANAQGNTGTPAVVQIRFVNSAFISPTIEAIADQVNDNGAVIIPLQVVASDDGSNLNYSAMGSLPNGLSINIDTGSITGKINVPITETTVYTVTIYVRDEDGNISSTSFNWTVNYVAPVALAVNSFTLIDANTDTPVAGYDPIPDGAVIDVSLLGTAFNIRANTQGSVGSVVFDLNTTTNFRTENGAPYALVGDSSGDYAAWSYVLDTAYTLIATPYSGTNGSGSAGSSASVTLTFVDGSTAPAAIQAETTLEPEPAED